MEASSAERGGGEGERGRGGGKRGGGGGEGGGGEGEGELLPFVSSIQGGVNLNLGTRAEPFLVWDNLARFFVDPDPRVFESVFGDLAIPKSLERMVATGEFGLPLVPDGFLSENDDDEEVGFDVPIAGTRVAPYGDKGLLAFPQDETRVDVYFAFYCLIPLNEGVSRLLEVDSGSAQGTPSLFAKPLPTSRIPLAMKRLKAGTRRAGTARVLSRVANASSVIRPRA